MQKNINSDFFGVKCCDVKFLYVVSDRTQKLPLSQKVKQINYRKIHKMDQTPTSTHHIKI